MTDVPEEDRHPPDPHRRKNGTLLPGNKSGIRRQKGTLNHTTYDIRRETYAGFVSHGFDGKGLDGYPGFIRYIAKTDPAAAAVLAGKMIPRDVHVDLDAKHRIETINIFSVPEGHVFVESDDYSKAVPMKEVLPELMVTVIPPDKAPEPRTEKPEPVVVDNDEPNPAIQRAWLQAGPHADELVANTQSRTRSHRRYHGPRHGDGSGGNDPTPRRTPVRTPVSSRTRRQGHGDASPERQAPLSQAQE